jgi:DNA-binding CsgD family transcriptional regulator
MRFRDIPVGGKCDACGLWLSTMNKAGVSSLTSTQREILRRVLLNYSSKGIARDIGASPHTVDNHIKAAMQRLGVSSRFEAARLLHEFEGDGPDRRTLASQASALARRANHAPDTFKPPEGDSYSEGLSEHDGVAAVAYSATPNRRPDPRLVPLPHYWGEPNGLTQPERVLRILWITALLGLAIGGVMASLRALSDLI